MRAYPANACVIVETTVQQHRDRLLRNERAFSVCDVWRTRKKTKHVKPFGIRLVFERRYVQNPNDPRWIRWRVVPKLATTCRQVWRSSEIWWHNSMTCSAILIDTFHRRTTMTGANGEWPRPRHRQKSNTYLHEFFDSQIRTHAFVFDE